MRRRFAELLSEEMKKNEKIVVITADLGYGLWDNIQNRFYKRFYNCGAAEQLMVGMGVGLALAGYVPICYSITPFLLCRPFEFIRNYCDYERVAVKLIGSGRGQDYENEGHTHWAEDERLIMSCFPNILAYRPICVHVLEKIFPDIIYNNQPTYVNLKK